MPNCDFCGSELRPGLKFCATCGTQVAGAPPREAIRRQSICPFCEAMVRQEEGFCGKCGKPLPADYDEYVALAVQAKRYQKKHSGLHLLWGLLSLPLIVGLYLIDEWTYFSQSRSRDIVLQIALISIFVTALLVLPIVWGVRRRLAFRRLGMTRAAYMRLLNEHPRFPEADIRRVSETLRFRRRRSSSFAKYHYEQ